MKTPANVCGNLSAAMRLLAAALLCANAACRHTPPPTLLLADRHQAAQWVTDDGGEGFFQRLTAHDMALQLGQPQADTLPWDTLRARHEALLRADVRDFTAAEAALLRDLLRPLLREASRRFPGLLPDTIGLVKTQGVYYGDGVFYTRRHVIVLPANELARPNHAMLARIMAHELFHLLSRRHPALRLRLFALVGFHPLPHPHLPLLLPDTLARHLLLNPDAPDIRLCIRVPTPTTGDTLCLVPLQVAQPPAFGHHRRGYMAHFRAGYHPVTPTDAGYRVHPRPVSLDTLPAFFTQTTRNTPYLIHPEEMLADNFALLLLGQDAPNEGKWLLRAMARAMMEEIE